MRRFQRKFDTDVKFPEISMISTYLVKTGPGQALTGRSFSRQARALDSASTPAIIGARRQLDPEVPRWSVSASLAQ